MTRTPAASCSHGRMRLSSKWSTKTTCKEGRWGKSQSETKVETGASSACSRFLCEWCGGALRYGIGFNPHVDAPEFAAHAAASTALARKGDGGTNGHGFQGRRSGRLTLAQSLKVGGGSGSGAFGLGALEEDDDPDVYDGSARSRELYNTEILALEDEPAGHRIHGSSASAHSTCVCT